MTTRNEARDPLWMRALVRPLPMLGWAALVGAVGGVLVGAWWR